ncbi:peptide ABC transporter permease [Sulfodiicoccus acidiphilus]|uniref:Peptide ABC transporter permease n=1 Tax=Sulfodiicoccus acidiphilus TaxID=1670455 RepID=A0A348B501_9CREN|nr:ABC transporter permease [Sulfodiicoccus acidiphilus]BBD73253.1 peptide ABC transporter permease [Sulfodiicoccus acidiphilus]GGT89575.1 peptide ABC transporter permease [Sulfodiicoccus acidiphilus]
MSSSSMLRNVRTALSTNKYMTAGLAIVLADLVFGIIGALWTPYPPNAMFNPSQPPSLAHLLGTDGYGHDVFSEMMADTLPTLLVGFAVGLGNALIALVVGLVGGYYGEGIWGAVIDVATILALTIPGIILLVVIGAYFASAKAALGYGVVVLALSLTGWAWGAKVIRSQVLSISKEEYILASKIVGERSSRIIFGQVLPPVLPLAVGGFLFGTLYGILSLVTAEFWGVIPVSTQNLGTMLSLIASSGAYLTNQWWWILGAMLPILVLAVGIGFMNIGFDQIADPRLKEQKTTSQEKIQVSTDEGEIEVLLKETS